MGFYELADKSMKRASRDNGNISVKPRSASLKLNLLFATISCLSFQTRCSDKSFLRVALTM